MVRKFFKWCWDHLGNLALLGGWAMSFAIPAWAAHAASWLVEFSPFSWVVAGLAGMVSVAITSALFARARLWLINGSIRQAYYRERDKPNPLDPVFTRQRINVVDLTTPFERLVVSKTFVECELMGPAVVFLSETSPGSLHLKGCSFLDCDAVAIDDVTIPSVAIVLTDCTLTDCRFYRCVLLFRQRSVNTANSLINGLDWITPTPTALATGNLFTPSPDEAYSPQSPKDTGAERQQ